MKNVKSMQLRNYTQKTKKYKSYYTIIYESLSALENHSPKSITGQSLFDNAGDGQYLSVSVQNETIQLPLVRMY